MLVGDISNKRVIFGQVWESCVHIVVQVTLYRRLQIGRANPKPTIYLNLYQVCEHTGEGS